MDKACAACAERSWATSVRDGADPVDTTLGLAWLGGDGYGCPKCGQRYRREVERASLFHDYDEYTFYKHDTLSLSGALGSSTDGCARCNAAELEAAWDSQHAEAIHVLVQESHFSIRITACSCGQRFVTVFTECIDWRGGEDDQTWLALPVTADEAASLVATREGQLVGVVSALAVGRRFMMRRFPTGGSMTLSWHHGGFVIGPHD